MDMLARREHSCAELHSKLCQQGYDDSLVAELVATLASEGLVSDERFVEAWIAARRGRGYGPVRIRQELATKGIAAALIDQCVEIGARQWMQDIQRVRQKKFGANMPQDFSTRARQARFLQYRGFTADQIRRALNADDFD